MYYQKMDNFVKNVILCKIMESDSLRSRKNDFSVKKL